MSDSGFQSAERIQDQSSDIESNLLQLIRRHLVTGAGGFDGEGGGNIPVRLRGLPPDPLNEFLGECRPKCTPG